MIGGCTVLVGEVATLIGCCLDIPDEVTAITLVALGTSLPDTFASKTAAQQDPYADASVGNVTGSNSVNVFLGLGLPWVGAAFYWESMGPNAAWKARYYVDETYELLFFPSYPDGGFIQPAGALAFSVAVYTAVALCALALFCVRRRLHGGELGGPFASKALSCGFLLLLWATYIAASSLDSFSRAGGG